MIVTISDRKKRRIDLMLAAMRRVESDLAAHASARGGNFVVFGSAGRGDIRHDSDFDILVDFPAPIERAARDFAEEVCIAHRIRPDVHLASEASPALLERARRDGRLLR